MKKAKLLAVIAILITNCLYATNYYVSNSGDDSNSGLTEEDPWQTIFKVNNFTFNPGDSILFKCGDQWIETLAPQSGTSDGYITYSSYGSGNKPVFHKSVGLGDPSLWVHQAPNIWETNGVLIIDDEERIENTSFDTGIDGWTLRLQGSARGTVSRVEDDYYSSPGCVKLEITHSGAADYHCVFSQDKLIKIVGGRKYRIRFRIKSSAIVNGFRVRFDQPVSPWSVYGGERFYDVIDTHWSYISYDITAKKTADDARLGFILGNYVPNGTVLFIDDISLREVDDSRAFTVDVGNILLDENVAALKKKQERELVAEGDFWYDEERKSVKFFAGENPAELYPNMKGLLSVSCIYKRGNNSYIIIDGLKTTETGGYGIWLDRTNYVTVRNCEVSWIGGMTYDDYSDRGIRQGNGIQVWIDCQNTTIEGNLVYECYDAGISNQYLTHKGVHRNVVISRNVVYNCEYSYEFFNRGEGSITENILVDHNTFYNAGYGWGHRQRPDNKHGNHIMMYNWSMIDYDVKITNNIFDKSRECAIFATRINGLQIDYNLYNNNTILGKLDDYIDHYSFSSYQHAGYEAHGLEDNPGFKSVQEFDFRLNSSSPAIGAASDGGDIGALPYNPANSTQMMQNRLDVSFYPNPVKGWLTISIAEPYTGDLSIELSDMRGVVMKRVLINSEHEKIDVRTCPPGVYVIKVTNNEDFVRSRLIIIES